MSNIEQIIAFKLLTLAGIRLLPAQGAAISVFIGQNELAAIPPLLFYGVFLAFKEASPCGYKGFGS